MFVSSKDSLRDPRFACKCFKKSIRLWMFHFLQNFIKKRVYSKLVLRLKATEKLLLFVKLIEGREIYFKLYLLQIDDYTKE